ncbi:MT-A70 family methyltransferase [Pantanalinema rosaneae CENA516]|uniref:MT-A70 family methyltransferase n=1 Tax=Pantanalinema rosaneae TaxID=1620701 RepID=UPI003D6E995D
MENRREAGQPSPRQVQLEWYGTYEEAVRKIEKSRLTAAVKQKYLTQLAKKEGLLDAGAVPFPEKHYSCIVADPPWFYQLRNQDKTHRNRIPYPAMQLEEILALPVPALADLTGCVLWLWTTNTHMPDACKCLEHWGFALKTILTWVKVSKSGTPHIGVGHWLRNVTEHCLLATKGKPRSFGDNGTQTLTNELTLLLTRRREHSRKPEEFYQLVEKLCPDLSKLEMFARQPRPGWESWGNEVEKFALDQ